MGERVLLANLLLALAWAALQGEFSLATLATGLVLGYLILLALVRGGVLPQSRQIGRAHRIIGLATFFLWELVRANLRLALDVVSPRYQIRPGIIAAANNVPTDRFRMSASRIRIRLGGMIWPRVPDAQITPQAKPLL